MTPTDGNAPLVTIGIVSYNRLLYLRALVESARACIEYPRLQWIVVDGESVEPGLREYLGSLDFVDELVIARCTHAEAMNTIVEKARGDLLLLLPEDIQFIARGPWLADMVEAGRRPDVGHITFDAQRRTTIRNRFKRRPVRVRGHKIQLPFRRPGRPYRVIQASSGAKLLGYGHTVPGVIGSGIMTFGRTDIWRRLGPWRENRALSFDADSGLGAEADMSLRFASSGLELQSFLLQVPVAADIVTDPRGTKARIRGGNRRYGSYLPPPEPPFYYRIDDVDRLRASFGSVAPAPAFEDIVVPVGFDLPLSPSGDLLKTSVISDDEPFVLVEGARPTG